MRLFRRQSQAEVLLRDLLDALLEVNVSDPGDTYDTPEYLAFERAEVAAIMWTVDRGAR